jgi:flagellar basal-body rod protein FlgB
MDLNKNSLLSSMTKKMGWLSERQRVLAENIANADTPAFVPKDLTPFDPKRGAPVNRVAMAATSPMHRAGTAAQGSAAQAVVQKKPYEAAPSGNSVVIEEQMMKAADTATDYQAITNLYRKQVNLIRTALGRPQNG